MRHLAALALLASLGACVPKDFTFSTCEGDGGCDATTTGSTTGSGGASACGNGATEAELGEECDAGADNTLDQDEQSIGPSTDGPIGCTTTCRNTVQWTRTDVSQRQSVFTSVVVTPTGVVAGGFSLAGDTSVILDRGTVAYSATRQIHGFDPAGSSLFTVTTNDAGTSNGVIGMAPGKGTRAFYLETFHEPGVQRGAFVKLRDQDMLVATTEMTSLEDGSTTIGPAANGQSAFVLGYNPGGMALWHVSQAGVAQSIPLSDTSMIGGDGGPGGIVGVGTEIVIAWGDRIARLDAMGNTRTTTAYVGAELTGICARPDGSTTAVGWYSDDTSYDPIVIWTDADGAEVERRVITGSPDVDGANAVACADDGSVVVVGEEGLTGETSGLTPRSRAWARRYDANRVLVWTRKHESYVVGTTNESDTDARAVAIDADGFVYVAGREMTNDTTASAWLRKYAP